MDLLFGDPRLPWPHPVCIMGNLMKGYESTVRPYCKTKMSEKMAGIAGVILAAGTSFFTVWLFLQSDYFSWIIALYFGWSGLAMGCLISTGKLVQNTLDGGEITSSRKAVSMLVSRDVTKMDSSMLRKTLADTLSENFTDAFMAPFFWLVITGPAGLWCYKAVSTLDSQWGYLTPKWRYFGWCAAKSDDILAWLPARLSVLTFWLVSRLFPDKYWSGSWPGLWRILQDAKVMPSPNSGLPMACCAWLCNGRMAGPAIYFGELIEKGWMGPPQGHLWEEEKISDLLKLLSCSTIAGGILLWASACCMAWLFR